MAATPPAPPPPPGIRFIRSASAISESPPPPHAQFQPPSPPDAHSNPVDSSTIDVFDIPAKNPPLTSLQRWKRATLVLNATRRFRYTARLDEEERLLKLRELREQRHRKFRASANAVVAVQRLQSSIVRNALPPSPSPSSPLPPSASEAPEASSCGGGAGSAAPDKDVELGALSSPAHKELDGQKQSSEESIFGVSAAQLMNILQNRDLEGLQFLGHAPGIAECLRSDIERGIDGSEADIRRRRTAFGSNTYPRQPPRWFIAFFWDACKDPTLIILMVCALLSLIFGIREDGWEEGWYDGASIAFAVLLVISVTSVSDYKQSLQFSALDEEKRNIQVEVVRGGRRLAVSIFDIVVGDVAVLAIGDQVPADGIFVQGHSLIIDESSMTGESKPVRINANVRPFLLSGCKVGDGFGTMLVTGVGTNTEWGQLMAVIGERTGGEETPLQVRLNGVATFIGKIGLAVASLVLIILVIFYFVGHTPGSNNSGKFKAGHTSATDAANSVVDAFAIAVTIVVVAVPEGLPLAVTLTLAYSMKKMMMDRALVRRLSACETMGGATCICSDKTGTLTLNQMSVVKAWVGGDFRQEALAEASQTQLAPLLFRLLLEGIAQNSSGSVFVPSTSSSSTSPQDRNRATEPEVTGSPTEKAVLSWGLKMGMDFQKVRSQASILQVESFNSTKKRAGVAVRDSETGDVRIHWKGAAEIVLRECDSMMLADGTTVPIEESTRGDLMRVIEDMAGESLRCIAFAYRDIGRGDHLPVEAAEQEWEIPESGLCLMAMVGIKDPCRPGVADAVKLCQAAGIKVRMVTGDNIATAVAIARECGILDDTVEGMAVEGVTFRSYTEEQRKAELPKISVMARSSPSDKLLMVRTLREMGNVVAVTGDGTNDAPALHEADIGLAMGIQGTDVAKDSSDIIILDDNFASVVNVVRWGRSVYFNIQKFIQFQLTVNVAALTINFVAAVSSGEVPLTAVQLLWVNLIMDTLGALALATEPPTDELMDRPPVGSREPIISAVMWRNILGQAAYQIALLLLLQFDGKRILKISGPDADRINNTVIFNAFVLCQLFNEVNARRPHNVNIFRGFFNNRLFLVILFTTLVLQIIIVEFLNKFASTIALSWQLWLVCIVIGSFSWPIAALLKLLIDDKAVASIQRFCAASCTRLRTLCCCISSHGSDYRFNRMSIRSISNRD